LNANGGFESQLAGLINSGERGVLIGGLKGVEKESLRVTPDGHIAQTPHPRALGSALTHPEITTDYSEALLELVTPAYPDSTRLLERLTQLHQYTYRVIGDERLWATSMPCMVGGDADIPIARYGRSHSARMKEVYREGLGVRYGRLMQAISGVHFNYSFPTQFWAVLAEVRQSRLPMQDFISAGYFGLLRSYRRHGWIVPYLFGVSPALCASFLQGRGNAGLQQLVPGTLYGPHATSLRMSDVGYRNSAQSALRVSVNSLDEYVRDLAAAIATPHPDYAAAGVCVDGRWRQLNANVLQIENEYYSFIRPKRVTAPGERPTKALARGGVQYVEVRSLDVSAFDPVGVNMNKLRFLEAFAAWCALVPSPSIAEDEQGALDANHVTVARRGREPGLRLQRDGRPTLLAHWAAEILDGVRGTAELLDTGDPARPYTAAVEVQAAKVADVELTPSARMLAELRASGEGFSTWARRMSSAHRRYFMEVAPVDAPTLSQLAQAAEDSLAEQERMEAADRGTFEQYLARWFA
jgi:glutamate--cysteine ligase